MSNRLPSIGYGTDFRYRSLTLAGAALVHQDAVIHAAFFRLTGLERSNETLSPLRVRRRRFEK
jgi:hypothetical protein